jgi:hypothetical protein
MTRMRLLAVGTLLAAIAGGGSRRIALLGGAMPRAATIRSLAVLVLLWNARLLSAQEAADTVNDSSSDVADQVLACAKQVARSAGFETQLSVFGTVLHAWRPHLQSMDVNETDYVRVSVYGRGSAKGLRWEVDAHTVTGRAFISTSVYSPRPPSRDADALKRGILRDCTPASDTTPAVRAGGQ